MSHQGGLKIGVSLPEEELLAADRESPRAPLADGTQRCPLGGTPSTPILGTPHDAIHFWDHTLWVFTATLQPAQRPAASCPEEDTHNVGACGAEGVGPTDIQVGLVQGHQDSDKVEALGLRGKEQSWVLSTAVAL